MSKARRLLTNKIIDNSGIETLEEVPSLMNNPNISVSETPLGSAPGDEMGTGLYVKDAVSWKGVKKKPNESLQQYLNRLGDYAASPNGGIGKGLGEAIDISQEYSGVRGKNVMDPRTGEMITRKDAAQAGLVAANGQGGNRRQAPEPEMEANEFNAAARGGR